MMKQEQQHVLVRTEPLPRNPEAGTWTWTLGAIHWRAVFAYQNWGAIFLVIPAIVLLVMAHFNFQDHPRYNDAYVYDATLSYPHTESTISNGTASLYPWLAMLITVFVVEFGLYYQQQSITSAAAAALHILWSCFVNFIIVLSVSEVTKAAVGSLRPNFLARCMPEQAQQNQPWSFMEAVARCTNTDEDTVNQGRLSFVSGHASNSLCVSYFTTLYLTWSLYWRENAPYASQVFGGGQTRLRTILRRVAFEALYSFMYAWLLFVLLLSWFTGCSRIWDHEHHAADVVGGLMLALLLTTPYVLKTIGQYAVFKRELDIYHATTAQGAQRLAALEPKALDIVTPAAAVIATAPASAV